MANPDIYITPGQGTIGFTGANTGTIQLRVAESGDLHFEGNQGSLLSVSDDLSDSLFSVNDAAGMPVFEVFADDTIKSYRNNESKLEIDPDNNRIRLRDNTYVSGDLIVSGDITSTSASHESTSYTASTHVSGLSGYFGKIGIGTTVNTYNSTLTIHNQNNDYALIITEKDSSTRGAIVMEANNARGWLGLKNATNTRIVLNAGGTSYIDEGPFYVGATSAAGSLFAVDGDVGITGELRIAKGGSSTSLSANSQLGIESSAHAGVEIIAANGSNSIIYLRSPGGYGYINFEHSYSRMNFSLNGAANHLSIDSVATQVTGQLRVNNHVTIQDGGLTFLDASTVQIQQSNSDIEIRANNYVSLGSYYNPGGGAGWQKTLIVKDGLVGIGTESPEALVQVSKTSLNALTAKGEHANYHLFLRGSDTDNQGIGLGFGGVQSVGASIIAEQVGGGHKSDLLFCTKNSITETVTPSEKMRITNDGKVGIGTDNPAYTFEVASSVIGFSYNGANGAGTQTIKFEPSSTRGGGISKIYSSYAGGAATEGRLALGTYGETTTLVMASGNVGIGTDTPASLFHIHADSSSAQEVFIDNNGVGAVGITLRTDHATDGSRANFIYFDAADDGGNNARYASVESFIVDNTNGTEDGRLTFSVMANGTDTESMTIAPTGAGATSAGVGIRTTSPIKALDVRASASWDGIHIGSTAGSATAIDFARSTTHANPTARIGVAEPAATHTSDMRFYTSDADGSAPNLVEKMRITQHGKVGIGVTTPQALLQVDGDVGITGELRVAGHSETCPGTQKLRIAADSVTSPTHWQLGIEGNNDAGIVFHEDTTQRGHVGWDHGKDRVLLGDHANDSYWGVTYSSDELFGNIAGADKFAIDASATQVTGDLRVQGVAISSSRSAGAGVGGSVADENSFEIGPGYVNFNRDDTAVARQIQFGKNGSLHSAIETSTSGLAFLGSDGKGDMIIKTDGNVGIGTASPDELLHVEGTSDASDISIKVKNRGTSNATQSNLDLHYSTADRIGARISSYLDDTSSNSTSLRFWTRINNGAKERMRLSSDGYLMIAAGDSAHNTDPEAMLTVSGNASITGELRVDDDVFINGGGIVKIVKDGDASRHTEYKYAKINSTPANDGFSFELAGSKKMFIHQGGNVGIGTTNPGELLHVSGNIQIKRDKGSHANAYLKIIGNEQTNKGAYIQGFRDSVTETVWALGHKAGLLGATLGAAGEDDFTFYTHADNDYRFYGGTNSTIIDGGLTVGSTSAADVTDGSKLRVNGDVGISGELKVGGVLIPNANGTHDLGSSSAYWRNAYLEDTAINGTLYVGGDVTITQYIKHHGDTDTFFGFPSNQHYVVRTNGTNRFLIDNYATQVTGQLRVDDAVKIVADNGNQLYLDNDGDQWTQINFAANGTNKAFVALDSTNNNFIVGGQGGGNKPDAVTLRPDGATDILIAHSAGSVGIRNDLHVTGDVGIGTESPLTTLHIKDAGTPTITLEDSSGPTQTAKITYDQSAQNTLTISTQYASPSCMNRINFAPGGQSFYGGAGAAMTIRGGSGPIGNGFVGVGTTAPTGKLHVYQSGDSQPALLVEGSQGSLFSVEDSLTGSLMSVNDIAGLPVFEAFDDGTIIGGQYNSGDFIISGNKVGIGTTNMSAYGVLEVVGGSNSPIAEFKSDASAGGSRLIDIYNSQVAAGYMLSVVNYLNNSRNAELRAGGSMVFSTAGTSSWDMLIDTAGNVGINTVAPDEKLHVSGNAIIANAHGSNTVVRIGGGLGSSAGSYGGGRFAQEGSTRNSLIIGANNGQGCIRMTSTNNSTYEIWADSTALHFDSMNSNRDFAFNSNSSDEKTVYITQGEGAVGIGVNPTSLKGARLAVSGDVSVTGELRVQTTDIRAPFVGEMANSNTAITSGPTAITICNKNATDGNFVPINFSDGIEQNSAAILGVKIESHSSNHGSFHFWTRGADYGTRMVIDHDGGVGIGVTSPQAKLQVNGDASITGELKVNANARVGTNSSTSKLAVNTAPDATITVQSHDNNENVFALLTDHSQGFFNIRQSDDDCMVRGYATTSSSSTQKFQLHADGVSYFKGGDVGIGTDNPDSKLEIVGGGWNSSLKIKGGGSHAGIQFEDSAGNTDGYIYAIDGNIGFLDAGGDWVIRCKNDDYIRFSTNGNTEHMRISSDGTVGIGTILSSGRLHVNRDGTGIIVANEHVTGNAFEVHGAQGNLLTITDDLSDSLFSVNDAAGMPVFEAFADDTIKSYRNNETKFEVSPDDNQIRLRDNVDISGVLTTSGQITAEGVYYTASSRINLGTSDSTSARLNILGNGATNSTTSMRIFRQGGAETMRCYDAGQTTFGPVAAPDSTVVINGTCGITGVLTVDSQIISTSTVDCTSLGVTTAIVHDGDSHTKITFDPDVINIEAGGVKLLTCEEGGTDGVIVNEDSNDVNFRVESTDQGNAFMVDAGTETVGIGAAASSAQQLLLKTHSADDLPFINFANSDGSQGSSKNVHETSSTDTHDHQGWIKIKVNGTDRYLAFYS